MPNEFASTQSSGLLKDYYPEDKKSPLQEALKRKRKKLAETKLGLKENEENENG